jgi:hypothetical protein
MHNVPNHIWNLVAEEARGLPEDFRRLCALDEEAQSKAIERMGAALKRLGYSPKVVVAYLVSLPSLEAAEPLRRFLVRSALGDLIPAIPVVEPEKLPFLMQAEWMMDRRTLDEYRRALRDPRARGVLRKSLPKPSTSAVSSNGRQKVLT